MSTKYYAYFKCCSCCGAPKKMKRIATKPCGWQFHFSGEIPEIVSVKDWYNITKQDDVLIVDEYEEMIPHEKFWELVKQAQENKENLNHYNIVKNVPETEAEIEYLKKTTITKVGSSEIWNDELGHSFSGE